MEQKLMIFDDQCINENKFEMCHLPINIEKVNIQKLVFSNKEPYDKVSCKYIIGYKINVVAMIICISKVDVYAKYSDTNNIDMNLLISDKEVLKNIIKYGIKLAV